MAFIFLTIIDYSLWSLFFLNVTIFMDSLTNSFYGVFDLIFYLGFYSIL